VEVPVKRGSLGASRSRQECLGVQFARRSGADAPADECDASNSAISLTSALASRTSRWSRWREMAFIMDFRGQLANVSDASYRRTGTGRTRSRRLNDESIRAPVSSLRGIFVGGRYVELFQSPNPSSRRPNSTMFLMSAIQERPVLMALAPNSEPPFPSPPPAPKPIDEADHWREYGPRSIKHCD
jgi:hypothetical protein